MASVLGVARALTGSDNPIGLAGPTLEQALVDEQPAQGRVIVDLAQTPVHLDLGQLGVGRQKPDHQGSDPALNGSVLGHDHQATVAEEPAQIRVVGQQRRDRVQRLGSLGGGAEHAEIGSHSLSADAEQPRALQPNDVLDEVPDASAGHLRQVVERALAGVATPVDSRLQQLQASGVGHRLEQLGRLGQAAPQVRVRVKPVGM